MSNKKFVYKLGNGFIEAQINTHTEHRISKLQFKYAFDLPQN